AYRVPAPQESAEHLSSSYRAAGPAADRPRPPEPRPHPAPPQHTKVVTAQRPRTEFAAPPPPPQHVRPHPGPAPAFAGDRNNSRRTAAVWIAIVAVLTLLVGVGGWWLGVGRFEAVPSIAGMDVEKATA